MNRSFNFFKSFVAILLMSCIVSITSCKNEPKQEDPKEVAEEQNEEKFDDQDEKEDDSEFLIAAAESDLMEIELGNLALAKGTHPEVKSFAKTLVADHTKSANSMKSFAQRMNVSLPAAITEKGLERVNSLKDKTGQEFDEKFAELMVKNHREAISKMESAADEATDPQIRTWAATLVPTLKGHLEHAQMLEDKVKKNK